jgi:hypothetical protein
MFKLIINHFIKRVICCNRGGGGGSEPSPPTPPPPAPSPSETSAQAIQAQIDALPKQLAAQQEFGPQFSQLDLEQLQRFGPQFAQAGVDLESQFGPQLAQATLESQNILDPSRGAGSQAIAEFLQAGPDDLSPEDLRQIQQSSRAAAAARGLSESGFSADDEVSRIFGARQNLKTRFLNTALSASGRLPAGGGTTAQSGFGGQGQLVQNVSPGTFFGGQASANQLAGSIFNTQGSIFGNQLANQPAGIGGLIAGSLAGGVGQGVGTLIGKCWVAAEIFGGWYHPKTCACRHYINALAPKWFTRFYGKYGEQFAKFISDKPFIKLILKPLFELFAFKGGYYGKFLKRV